MAASERESMSTASERKSHSYARESLDRNSKRVTREPLYVDSKS